MRNIMQKPALRYVFGEHDLDAGQRHELRRSGLVRSEGRTPKLRWEPLRSRTLPAVIMLPFTGVSLTAKTGGGW